MTHTTVLIFLQSAYRSCLLLHACALKPIWTLHNNTRCAVYLTISSCVAQKRLCLSSLLSTWEVWRARKRRKSCTRLRLVQLYPLECSPNFPSAQYLDIPTAAHTHSMNWLFYNIIKAINAAVNWKFYYWRARSKQYASMFTWIYLFSSQLILCFYPETERKCTLKWL